LPGPADDAAREAAHEPSGTSGWEEAWGVALSGAGGVWGFVRLAVRPAEQVASYWATIVAPEIGLVLVRDDEVVAPRVRPGRRVDLEARADGLWAELVCETPMEHWGLRLEAFGIRLDDPLDARHGEWGERLPVGLDLEWETVGRAVSPEMAVRVAGGPSWRYAHLGVVHGELLVGRERLGVDGPAAREHSWGASLLVRDAWRLTGWGGAAALDAFGATGAANPAACWAGADVDRVTNARWDPVFDATGRPERARLELDGNGAGAQTFDVTVTGAVPLTLGRDALLWRTRCALSGPWDGEGWADWVGTTARASA
jgi:hypothetical protein